MELIKITSQDMAVNSVTFLTGPGWVSASLSKSLVKRQHHFVKTPKGAKNDQKNKQKEEPFIYDFE